MLLKLNNGAGLRECDGLAKLGVEDLPNLTDKLY